MSTTISPASTTITSAGNPADNLAETPASVPVETPTSVETPASAETAPVPTEPASTATKLVKEVMEDPFGDQPVEDITPVRGEASETNPDSSGNHEVGIYESFDTMGLPEKLLRGVYGIGFEKPSSIQQKAIVQVIKGLDVIGQAQSGTGKTGAFAIGSLARLKSGREGPQILIISPTRELSDQTYNVLKQLSLHMDIKIMHCVGGTSVNQDMRTLKEHVDVIVGTPGRIYDLIRRDAVYLRDIQLLVIDEADEMLSYGFKEQIYNIFVELPRDIQVCLFSATLPPEVLDLTKQFMNNPVKILVKNDELTLEGIRQYYISLDQEDWKLDTLIDLYQTLTLTQTIIYVNTKRKCQWVTHRLREAGYAVSEIHSDLPSRERKEIMASFKSGATRILITTDLLARGIDIQQVSLIVNYDLPHDISNYIHRIGRSGRYGRKGIALNFVCPHDINKLKEIIQYYSTDIPEMPQNIGAYI